MTSTPKNWKDLKSPGYQKSEPDQKIEYIIASLDYLKEEAKKTGNEDIYRLIDSTFTICLHTYCMIKRYEMQNHLPNKSE